MTRPGDPSDLEALLAERERIDQALHAKMARRLTVMFTDIVGSTEYFERKGDLEGIALIKRHNDLLFPIVAAHRGRIVKTIGDAIMAVFDLEADAVLAAVAMQAALVGHRRAQPRDALHIRIGVHAGEVLERDRDVFGDTVNTAARIAAKAGGDEIFASEALYDSLPAGAKPAATSQGALPLKGKAAPCPIVALEWSRFESAGPAGDDGLLLELQTSAGGLKVSASEARVDPGAVKTYDEVPENVAGLDRLVQGLSTFMHPSGATSYRTRVSELGAELYRRALPPAIERRLRESSATSLRLQVDDALVHVPWELMHDGKEFLGTRFAVGRMVAARANAASTTVRGQAMTGPAVVVADPSGDLPAATDEGRAIAGLLKDGFAGDVRLLSGTTRRHELLAALRGCRLLHFAGHAERGDEERPGGFRVADGVVTATELTAALGDTAPTLVFGNACHASTESGWLEPAHHTASLAATLLMSGVGHYLAPMWEIPDRDALGFALRFYERLLTGVPFGEAVRTARISLRAEQRHVLSFAGYVLYGDPRARLAAARLRPLEAVRGTSRPLPRVLEPKAVQRIAATAGVVATVGVLAFAAWQYWHEPSAAELAEFKAAAPVTPAAPSTTAAQPGTAVPTPPDPARHTGPLRLTVLPFKNLSTDPADASLKISDALQEAVVTDILGVGDIRVVEHAQIDVNILYLDDTHSKHYDPAFMAELGKLSAAEVVVLGAYQRVGGELRANARLVDSETGEILDTVKVDRRDGNVLKLQDDLARGVRASIDKCRTALRPAPGK